MVSRRAGAFEKLVLNRRIGVEDAGTVLQVILHVDDDRRASVRIEFVDDPQRKPSVRKIRR